MAKRRADDERTDRVRRLLKRWQDPVAFAHDALGIKCWPRQAELLRAVPAHRKVACKAGQKVSKSNSAAIIALWWPIIRPGGYVVLTAPTARQVRKVLWRETRALYQRAKWPLGGELHKVPESGWDLPGGRGIVGFSTDDPQAFQGFSGKDLLIIVDEANGFREDLWAAVHGNLGGGGHLLAIGNPIEDVGDWSRAWKSAAAIWHTLTISSLESPNYLSGTDTIPGLVTRQYVEDMRIAWGEDSPMWRARIEGQFPEGADNRIIATAMVEAAQERWRQMHDGELPKERLNLGVDVARFGSDESVVQPRRGNWAPMPTVVNGYDTHEVTQLVVRVARDLRASPSEKVSIKIDGSNMGAGVVDNLRHHHGQEFEVHDINAASATDETYARLRDQLWFGIRTWVLEGGALPPDDKLVGELTAPTYSTDARNRIKVESKDDIKKKLGRSPDRADALALSVHHRDEPSTDILTFGPGERSTLGYSDDEDDDEDEDDRW